MQPENDEIAQIKRQIGVYDLALASGHQLKKISANEYACRCPFGTHEDKNASLHINPSKNIFHCKGCGACGSPIDYVVHERKVSVGEAIRILKAKLPALFSLAESKTYTNGGQPMQTNDLPEDLRQLRLEPENQKVLRTYTEACHKNLKDQQLPIDHLMKRGIVHGEIVDEHLVGFASGDLLEKIKGDKELVQRFLKVGILRYDNDKESETYGKILERFAGCIVFPIINTDGVITGIYGRRIAGTGDKHNYLPGGHLGFFNPRALIAKEVIVTESIIDALSLMTLGYRNVIASYGAQGFTDEIRDALISGAYEKLYVAFDADNGGNRGAEKIVEKLKGSAVQIYRIELPDGFDPNDFIRKEPNAQAVFKDLLLNSSLLYSSLAEKEKESAKEEKFRHNKTSDGEEFDFMSRKYLVRGLEDNKTLAALKVFLRAMKNGHFHHDNFDLYTAKSVEYFTKKAAEKLTVDEKILRADIDVLTLKLEQLRKSQTAKNGTEDGGQRFHRNLAMDKTAREFLEDPMLILRFAEACAASGVVGEPLVCFVSFLATLTRFFEIQLHILIQSESSSGKSTIQKLTKDFTPEERLHFLTDVSPNMLYYNAEGAYWEVVIFIAEAEGIEGARFAVKQMMSDGILSKGSTITDPKTGQFMSVNHISNVRSVFIITLPKELEDDEFINRCLCLTLDESPEQRRRINETKRKLRGPEGVKIRAARKHFTELFQHVQRSLEVLPVLNPYSDYFDFTSDAQRSLRDQDKFLSLCDAITFLLQRQRERVTMGGQVRIKTHLTDVALAYFIARRVFPSTLDSLPPQGRKFFREVLTFMKEISERDNIDIMNVEIYRKEIETRLKRSTTRIHELFDLLELHECLLRDRDKRGIRYRLHFRPDDSGEVTSDLNLAPLSEIKKKASRKERDEYEAFLPQLKLIFKALDQKYTDGEY